MVPLKFMLRMEHEKYGMGKDNALKNVTNFLNLDERALGKISIEFITKLGQLNRKTKK